MVNLFSNHRFNVTMHASNLKKIKKFNEFS